MTHIHEFKAVEGELLQAVIYNKKSDCVKILGVILCS